MSILLDLASHRIHDEQQQRYACTHVDDAFWCGLMCALGLIGGNHFIYPLRRIHRQREGVEDEELSTPTNSLARIFSGTRLAFLALKLGYH